MPHTLKRVQFNHRGFQVREIAKGIVDKEERQVVLKFVQDAEKLVEVAPPEMILTVLSASEPKN